MNTEEINTQISEQIYAAPHELFLVSKLSTVVELVAYIIVLGAVIYMLVKTKAPGSILMLIGIGFNLLYFLIYIAVSNSELENLSKIIWFSNILSSGFVLVFAVSLIKLAHFVVMRHEKR